MKKFFLVFYKNGGFSLCRELQGSQASKAPEDQWDQGGMKGHLERKAEGEQKDHMAQKGPKETVLVSMSLCIIYEGCVIDRIIQQEK